MPGATNVCWWKKVGQNMFNRKKVCFLGDLEIVLMKAEDVLYSCASIQYSSWQSSKLEPSDVMYPIYSS